MPKLNLPIQAWLLHLDRRPRLRPLHRFVNFVELSSEHYANINHHQRHHMAGSYTSNLLHNDLDSPAHEAIRHIESLESTSKPTWNKTSNRNHHQKHLKNKNLTRATNKIHPKKVHRKALCLQLRISSKLHQKPYKPRHSSLVTPSKENTGPNPGLLLAQKNNLGSCRHSTVSSLH